MQAGLLGKLFQRLRERLRGNRGSERFRCSGLGERGGDLSEGERADVERAHHSQR